MKGLNKENKLNKLLSEGFYKELLIELPEEIAESIVTKLAKEYNIIEDVY